jgi:hypothetical protein
MNSVNSLVFHVLSCISVTSVSVVIRILELKIVHLENRMMHLITTSMKICASNIKIVKQLTFETRVLGPDDKRVCWKLMLGEIKFSPP